MPTYSYKCASCAHEFDVQQSINEETKTLCPECGGELQKVFGKVGISFKGTGFYRTDNNQKPAEPKTD